MKILALSLTLLGTFILIIMLNLSHPLIVNNSSELSKLTDNTKVQTTGRVISENALYKQTKLLKLDTGIEILCQACPNYQNKTIQVLGTTENYQNKTQINTLRIIQD